MSTLTEQRSSVMRAVRGRDTKPEIAVRRLLHRMGYRYRLHRSDLPGKPDIVLGSRSKVIFVHGCFWHGHDCKRGNRMPRTNARYWKAKIARNIDRYSSQINELTDTGWAVLTLWECELRNENTLTWRLKTFLDGANRLAHGPE